MPTHAALQLQVISRDYSFPTLNPTFVSGTAAQAVWTADVAFPLGFSRGYLQATWSP